MTGVYLRTGVSAWPGSKDVSEHGPSRCQGLVQGWGGSYFLRWGLS